MLVHICPVICYIITTLHSANVHTKLNSTRYIDRDTLAMNFTHLTLTLDNIYNAVNCPKTLSIISFAWLLECMVSEYA